METLRPHVLVQHQKIIEMRNLKNMPHSKAVLGAKLSLEDPDHKCLFADRVHGDEKHQDFESAPDDEYKPDVGNFAASNSIAELLLDCNGAVKTLCFTLFGVFTVWESNMLEHLMGRHAG